MHQLQAINSEDTDLIYYTLICLESRLSSNQQQLDYFFKISHIHPEAANLLKIYYRNKSSVNTPTTEKKSILLSLLTYSKNYFEAGSLLNFNSYGLYNSRTNLLSDEYLKLLVKSFVFAGFAAANQAVVQPLVENKIPHLKEASVLFAQGKEKDTGFYKTMTDELVELLEIQRNLDIR